MPATNVDVVIIGGGPAGLSASIVLGRARRSVVLFDHGKYRNFAADAVHCYLGLDGVAPGEFRARGINEAHRYGVRIKFAEVTSAKVIPSHQPGITQFQIVAEHQLFLCRALILATGIQDQLPNIPGLKQFYGHTVHHCPYCDGWEHRDKRLVALGGLESATELALSLRGWSTNVTACTHGQGLAASARQKLAVNGVELRIQMITQLTGEGRSIRKVIFDGGDHICCDALFFSADQTQSSEIPTSLGCGTGDDGLVATNDKQCANIEGLFIAGDIHSDVQMVSVAAAEGVIAATSANKLLLLQDAVVRGGKVTN
jgi:thioredoxin reductase